MLTIPVAFLRGIKQTRRNPARAPLLPRSSRYPPPLPPPPNTTISSLMTSTEIARVLTSHGCIDLTPQISLHSCSSYPISNGGFGDIFSGKLVDGTSVAIKVFRFHIVQGQGGKYLKRAAKELHIWSKCRHPHVLRLLGLVQFRGQIGMVSPWVDGGDIRFYLCRHPNINRRQLCFAISDGLTYLHRIGITHGDLKGANVLVLNDKTPLLADFGSSVLSNQSLNFTATTAKSNISIRWTAPEVLEGSVASSCSADVYALGMTMLETLTGDVPFVELERDVAVSLAVLNKKVPTRPEAHIPTNGKHDDILWSLLLQCWAYEPENRPKAELVRDMMSEIANPSDSLDNLMAMTMRLDPVNSARTVAEGPAEGISMPTRNLPDRPEEEVDHD